MIPGGGDLAPPRRRRYGGSYGRKRHRRNRRIGIGLLLLAVAAGAAYLLRQEDASVPGRVATLRPCPTPTVSPTPVPVQRVVLPRPQQVSLTVLNGTSRDGLAKTIGDRLAALGFVVTDQANAPAALAGASTVTFGTGAEPAGTLVSRWVLGSRLIGNPKAPPGSVQVVLGSGFQRLATPAEVAAASRPAVTPTVPAVTTPTGCPA